MRDLQWNTGSSLGSSPGTELTTIPTTLPPLPDYLLSIFNQFWFVKHHEYLTSVINSIPSVLKTIDSSAKITNLNTPPPSLPKL